MEKKDFVRILQKFADNPDEVTFECGEFLADIDGSMVSGTLKKTAEGLICIENKQKLPIRKWIAQRLGKLDILAQAILDKIPEDRQLIPVPATIDLIDTDKKNCEDVVTFLVNETKKQLCSDFSTNVVYLTSEAGEGKTCIMNEIARRQATLFKKKKSDWLFVPIALSGRPFLRLDEIIIGTLANFYRFRSYYIESFLELVKQGFIVLGLDGFEEMAIEGTEGDVISSLGNLLDNLDSEGTMIFATRKAYYNYTKLDSQAKLFDSFEDKDVSFSEIYVTKWQEPQFEALLEKFGFNRAESQKNYENISTNLSGNHPILTRAVLARRLAEEIYHSNGNSIASVIDQFKNGDQKEVFLKFVDMILRRETKKWIHKGEIAEPLLSIEQHQQILELLAEEMWLLNTEKLKENVLIQLTELACDAFTMPSASIAQCKERILHHALITLQTDGLYSFCHEEFYQHFLGRCAANTIVTGSKLPIRKLLERKIFPLLATQECCHLITSQDKVTEAIDILLELAATVVRSSCLSQNIGSIVIPLLQEQDSLIVLNDLYCSAQVLSCARISNVEFRKCLIERISFNSRFLNNVTFCSCDINEIIVEEEPCVNITLDNIPQKLIYRKNEFYNPKDIESILNKYGFNIGHQGFPNDLEDPSEDEKIRLFLSPLRKANSAPGLIFAPNSFVRKTLLYSQV